MNKSDLLRSINWYIFYFDRTTDLTFFRWRLKLVCFPFSSFMATNSKQTKVTLTRKFSTWEYSWRKSLNKRMPWFDAKGSHNKALLTTSSSPTFYPSGSIIWGNTDRRPADWIWYGGMRDPGVIWYWVNEDDCDEDRKPGKNG